MALTSAEQALIRNAFYQGPAALLEHGFSAEDMTAFLRRPEVIREINLLNKEYEEQGSFHDRTKFTARRSLARLLNGATAVLARGLAGPVYRRDPDGNIMLDNRGNPILRDPEPTSGQIQSAKEVFNQLGVSDERGIAARAFGSDVNVTLMLQAAEETAKLSEDPNLVTEEQRSLSREKVRNAIDILKPLADKARAEALGEEEVKEDEA
jgi:hypothetical protein